MYYSLSKRIQAVETSNIIYYRVIDAKCDNKETLLSVMNTLYSEFIQTDKKANIILEGDQATYERIQSLKAEYKEESSWLIPFVGNWHFLKNFQEVVLKVYFDAGLRELAIAGKYLPNSIGTNFTRTHLFLLEVWESLFRVLMAFYVEQQSPDNFLSDISHMIQNFPPCELQASAYKNLQEIIEEISDKAKDMTKFQTFIETHSKQNVVLKFWCQFLGLFCLYCFTFSNT